MIMGKERHLRRPHDVKNGEVCIWHFARGMAYAALGRANDATRERDALKTDSTLALLAASPGNNQAPKAIVDMARLVLSARIDVAMGRYRQAAAKYRKAVTHQDRFLYVEPPDWYAPARQTLGATLLMSGNAASAAQVFREDLRRNPGNPGSLAGLRRAVRQGATLNPIDLL